MPQYYDLNANAGIAFSEGLAAGFEFVDRIKARRRQLDLEERSQNRADRQLKIVEDAHEFNKDIQEENLSLAKDADARAAALEADRAEAAQYERDRRPEIERREKEMHDATMQESRVRVGATQEAINTQRAARQAAEDVARMTFEALQPPEAVPPSTAGPSLAQVGAAPITAPPSAASRGPVDLRADQAERDSAPNFLQRAANDLQDLSKEVAAKSTKEFWKSVANPGKEALGRGSESATIRRNPLSYLPKYLEERDKVDAADRPALDVTMRNALMERRRAVHEEIAAAGDPQKAAQLRREKDLLGQQLDKLSRAVVSSAPQSAGITQSVKVSDPRVAQAVATGATAFGNTIPSATPDEMRALNTQLGRIGSQKRLTPKQIETLAKARAYGVVDDAAVMNWAKYGSPLVPAQPKIIPMSEHGMLAITPAGVSFIPSPTANKVAATKLWQSVGEVADIVESKIVAGEIDAPEKSGKSLVANGLALVQANAQAFQQQTGIRVIDENGNFDASQLLTPQNWRVLVDYTLRTAEGSTDPRETELPIEGSENAAKTIPITSPFAVGPDGIIDMTAEFSR